MAVILKQPSFLIEEAKKLGVDIKPVVEYDPRNAIIKVGQQLKGGSYTFGAEDAEFGSFLRHFIGRKADRAVGKVAKKIGPALAIASFVVPGVGPLVGGSALAAMAAADKLMGDPKQKNAAQIISNTKAMAALGDPNAKRGALVLATVSQIRDAKKTPMGKPAIPYQGPIVAQSYTQRTPRLQVKALAQVAVKGLLPRRTFWQKVKDLFKHD